MRAIWGAGRGLRCKEIVLTLFTPGHRIDPHQYFDYVSLISFHRAVTQDVRLQSLFVRAWGLRNSSQKAHGVVKSLWQAVHRLGWQWVEPFVLITSAGHEVRILCDQISAFKHAIREAQRTMLWQRAASRRDDMQGIEVGIDRVATLAVLGSRKCDDY
eukprot:3220921-Karenia_brevis.AAC.1